MFMSFSCS
ncbi:hypothetical protein ECEC1735_3420, partial [Escherichia coli EC1735]